MMFANRLQHFVLGAHGVVAGAGRNIKQEVPEQEFILMK